MLVVRCRACDFCAKGADAITEAAKEAPPPAPPPSPNLPTDTSLAAVSFEPTIDAAMNGSLSVAAMADTLTAASTSNASDASAVLAMPESDPTLGTAEPLDESAAVVPTVETVLPFAAAESPPNETAATLVPASAPDVAANTDPVAAPVITTASSTASAAETSTAAETVQKETDPAAAKDESYEDDDEDEPDAPAVDAAGEPAPMEDPSETDSNNNAM